MHRPASAGQVELTYFLHLTQLNLAGLYWELSLPTVFGVPAVGLFYDFTNLQATVIPNIATMQGQKHDQ